MLKYYREFFHYFAKGYKKYIPVVIGGAAIAGALEIIGKLGILIVLPDHNTLLVPKHFLIPLAPGDHSLAVA